MNPYQLGLYEKSMPAGLSLGQRLTEARAAGFDYLELSIDETDEKLARLDWSEAEIRTTKAAQDEAGISIKSICLSGHRRFPLGHPDPAVQARSLEIMGKAISLASRLGVRLIQIAGYDVYYETPSGETRRSFDRNLRASALLAAREGVTLAFETMETDFINTVAKARAWVDLVDSPYLQIYPDLGNITNAALASGGNVLSDLESGRGRLAAVHLKETRPGIFREVPYGEGHVDFEGGCRKALDLGVRLFVGEFWHTGEAGWRDILRANNAFLRRALETGLAHNAPKETSYDL